ncbi:MAG: glycosyltransferase family 4 protein [Candidatus Bathyarchaeota archaeon]|nr:glycosyltransferase family 4 protein [Candidatus Bathyarchaeota archaeon]
MDIRILCDLITTLEGSVRPAAYLAEDLATKGYNVTIVSPLILKKPESELHKRKIKTVNLNVKHFSSIHDSSVLWFEIWLHEALLRLNSRQIKGETPVAINFSHVIFAPSIFWYLQGPPSAALRDILHQFSIGFKVAYSFLNPIFEYLDGKLIKQAGRRSFFAIANSKFCAQMYYRFGLRVHDVMYPPLDRDVFQPSTSSPSEDYVLTYFGKETKFSIVKKIADLNVKIKAFGSKTSFIDRRLLKHPNVDFMGRISTSRLVDLYSNALFTLFPFTHEPFGYIPLESMACGTPTLTYSMQGPGEYIVDGENGWLVKDDESFVKKALDLWRNGYPSIMRKRCVERAMAFDRSLYFERWLKLLESFNVI